MADAQANHTSPNEVNTLDAHALPMTVLGVDCGRPLRYQQSEWKQTLGLWQRARANKGAPAPIFAGRYFFPGHQLTAWHPGEAQSLRRKVPLAHDLRYILPLSQPPQENTKKGRAVGQKDGKATAKAIRDALESSDPQHVHLELLPPKSGALLVFLCLDWVLGADGTQVISELSQQYWMGWSESIRADSTVALSFLPALYVPQWNTVGTEPAANSVQYWSIKNAFGSAMPGDWDISKHTCEALMTPSPSYVPFGDALKATDTALESLWPEFETLSQHGGREARVVVWQYRINVWTLPKFSPWKKSGEGPTISATGKSSLPAELTVRIRKGGERGEAKFEIRVGRKARWSDTYDTKVEVNVPHTEITLHFPEGQYVKDTTYTAMFSFEFADGNDASSERYEKVHDVDLDVTSPQGFRGEPAIDYMLVVPD